MTTAARIRAKVEELARAMGNDPRRLTDDDILPQSGLLDSASILELILWVESEFGFEIDQGDLSLDNFGTIRRMTEYISARTRE
ncbi:MAG TPA: acyl carrier protein [Vicinamibacterales bacterium]|nr:acyl carrier protein [Vicinamibacterales bacterium]